MSLATYPDDAPCYVPGYGETTLGEIRHTEQTPDLADVEKATIAMWVDIGTRNLCLEPWDPGATVAEIRAFHVSRFTNAVTERASS